MGAVIFERRDNPEFLLWSHLLASAGPTWSTKRIGLRLDRMGTGVGPALLSLAMLLTYSVVPGIVYAVLNTWKR